MTATHPEQTALTGGTWTLRGNVHHWQPTTAAPPPAPTWLADLIACPYCRARVTETCRTPAGNPVAPHACRLAPRLCPCGALAPVKKLMCEQCRVQARRETYRLRERRKPTRERRAA